jgi:hypothetical protein
MCHADHLHSHLFVDSVDAVSHAGDHLIKIDHLVGAVLLNLLPDEMEAFAEDERTGEIGRHTYQDVGTLLLVERGEVGAAENGDRCINLIGKERGDLSVIALPHQYGHHLMPLFTQDGSQGECLSKVASSFSLNSEQESHAKTIFDVSAAKLQK